MRELSDDGAAVESMLNKIDGTPQDGESMDAVRAMQLMNDAAAIHPLLPAIVARLCFGATIEQTAKAVGVTSRWVLHLLAKVKAIANKRLNIACP